MLAVSIELHRVLRGEASSQKNFHALAIFKGKLCLARCTHPISTTINGVGVVETQSNNIRLVMGLDTNVEDYFVMRA